jgi:FKBP-type peptidyl-prolyl cis-trans isomerase
LAGKRRLIIPAELGFGSRSRRGVNGEVLIPPDSMLVFEIELLEIRKP